MKIATALRYTREIHRRLVEVDGLIPTPDCDYSHMKVTRVWVFGSTVKGSENPNDLDLLIEMSGYGNIRTHEELGVFDIRYARTYGMRRALPSSHRALVWLGKGMKHVSRHWTREEMLDPDVKFLIYPAYEVPAAILNVTVTK